jgi:hypothetical protein
MGAKHLTRADVLRVAAGAFCAVETVRRYCRGENMHGVTLDRVGNALRELGFEPDGVRGSEAAREAV